MDSADLFRDMLVHVAEANDTIEAVLQLGDRTWAVNFGEKVNIEVDIAPSVNKIFFTVPVGVPKEDSRAHILDVLMSYNAAWQQTGGVSLGQTAPGGEIILRGDIVLGDASEDLLETVLLNMQAKADLWIDFVATGAFPGDADASEHEFMIRV